MRRWAIIIAAMLTCLVIGIGIGQRTAPKRTPLLVLIDHDARGPTTRELRDADPAFLAALDRPIGDFRCSGKGFSDVVDDIRDRTKENIFVNWRALQTAGIARDPPVTLDLPDATLATCLTALLKAMSSGNARCGFSIDDGVITISTADQLDLGIHTRVYDVRDALANDPSPTRAQAVTQMIASIQGIDPLTWGANGGKVGAIKELSGQLVITQTLETHQRIAAYCDEALSKARAARPPSTPSPGTRPADGTRNTPAAAPP